jgi:hypothetical protein
VLKAAIFLAIAMISLPLTSLPIVLRPLELNLKLQEMFPRIPVVVEWTGETDVSESELADYLLEIMARGGFKPRAPPGFDIVEAVREARGGR